jgi:hypothetical protein
VELALRGIETSTKHPSLGCKAIAACSLGVIDAIMLSAFADFNEAGRIHSNGWVLRGITFTLKPLVLACELMYSKTFHFNGATQNALPKGAAVGNSPS